MHHNWSDKELLKFYEEEFEKGTIREGGSAYKRMLKFKSELEIKLKKKRIERMRKANKLMQSSNGKAKKWDSLILDIVWDRVIE